MSYKVQYKVNKSRIIKGEKFPYNQIRVVSKGLFNYIKSTFPNEFNFYEPKPLPKQKEVAEKRAAAKSTSDLGSVKKVVKPDNKG
jgi:hypothetical protein